MSYYYAVLEAQLGAGLGNPFVAAFTYETSEIIPTSAGAVALGDDLVTNLIDTGADLLQLLPIDLEFTALTITSPPVPTVLSVRSLSNAGEGLGDYTTAFEAYEWTSPRTVANIRPGFKRFGPTLKANVADGVISAGALTIANNVAGVLSTTLTGTVSGIGVNFTPVVVKRIPYTTPGGSTAYRLPGAGDPYVRSIANNWAYARITTQNSRKR